MGRWYANPRPLLSTITKILLVAMALWTVEPFSNCFKTGDADYETEDFLYLSNIAAVYAAVTVLAGISRTAHPGLFVAHSFAVPTATVLSSVVATVFWTLFFVKRSMVTRTNSGSGVWPVLHECPKHIFPLLALAIDHAETSFSKTVLQRVFIFVFGMVYYLICEVLVHKGVYLYPFLEYLSFWGRSKMFMSAVLLSILLYEIVY